jgi:phage terminase large subunit
VSENSFEVLIPTIRRPGSEIWVCFNPDDPRAYAQRLIESPRPDQLHEHVIFSDNPWFPPELERERVYLASVDDAAYRHVWLGECRTASDVQILKGKYVIEEFAPDADWAGPYFGADWASLTIRRCW